jgi:hypothetical protein
MAVSTWNLRSGIEHLKAGANVPAWILGICFLPTGRCLVRRRLSSPIGGCQPSGLPNNAAAAQFVREPTTEMSGERQLSTTAPPKPPVRFRPVPAQIQTASHPSRIIGTHGRRISSPNQRKH